MRTKVCGTLLCVLSTILALLVFSNTSRADELPAAPEGTFSIVVIPDTQHYRGRGTKSQPDSQDPLTNPTFDAWTDWIAANLKQQRIVLVSHVGDIVDKNNREQWAVARRCMDKLHGKVPYGISVGNHDMSSDGNSSLFAGSVSPVAVRGLRLVRRMFRQSFRQTGHLGQQRQQRSVI